MLRKDYDTEFTLNQAIIIKHFKGLKTAISFCLANNIKPELTARVLLNTRSRRYFDWQ
jgi:hypothetical protein